MPENELGKSKFVTDAGNGNVTLKTRFDLPVVVDKEGRLRPGKPDDAPAVFEKQVTENGLEKALRVAEENGTVILTLGCHPMVNAKEEEDRTTLALPALQRTLLEKVGRHGIVVLCSNYPYTFDKQEENADAILWTATGAQDIGLAVAETLMGDNVPAGRLNMTWYASDAELTGMDEYDLVRGKQTYRYFDGKPMYPFGYGLSYTTFSYGEPEVKKNENGDFAVSFSVTNTGSTAGDEVAQVYRADPEGNGRGPAKQLCAFARLKGLQSGETRRATLTVPREEMSVFDPVKNEMTVQTADFRLEIGPDSAHLPLWVDVHVEGETPVIRSLQERVLADRWHDFENVLLIPGQYGLDAVTPKENVKVAFYVTDFDSSRIRFLDDSHTFTAFLEYRLRGGESKTVTLENLKSGDAAFDLGPLPAGDYEMRLWARDSKGRESHRVIHDFRVAPAEDFAIPADKIYRMTESDLATYGLRNDGDVEKVVAVAANGATTVLKSNRSGAPGYTVTVPLDEKTGKIPLGAVKKAKVIYDAGYDRTAAEATAVTNAVGIQRLLDEKAAAGFRKIVMLPGTYRISHTKKIYVPDGVTFDLGGAVLKQNGFAGASSLLVNLSSVRDAHLVNGTLEGDYWEHDYAGSPNNSEWPAGFQIGGDSWYSSVENVKVDSTTIGSSPLTEILKTGDSMPSAAVSVNVNGTSVDLIVTSPVTSLPATVTEAMPSPAVTLIVLAAKSLNQPSSSLSSRNL